MPDSIERPDLSGLPADVVAYIEQLEAKLAADATTPAPSRPPTNAADFSEPPGSQQVITISAAGLAKRTPRHLYTRQGRGGMGVFDIDLPEDDEPVVMVAADLDEMLFVFTRDGRAYRLPTSALAEQPVRARGEPLAGLIPLAAHDRVVAVLAERGGSAIALVSQRGWVRRVRSAYLGQSLIPGTSFHDQKEGGPLVGACWTSGSDDLFIGSRDGKGIRFNESQVPARGCLGIRLDPSDEAIGIAGVAQDGQLFLLGEDGRGTIREMSGFAANRAPGAGGKLAMKTARLVSVAAVAEPADIMVISRLSKMIRFGAGSVPPKSGVVQGVNCMSLRADEAAAATVISLAEA